MVDPVTAMGATSTASKAAVEVPAVVAKAYTYVGSWVALCGGLSVLAHAEGYPHAPLWFAAKALGTFGIDASWADRAQAWLVTHSVAGSLAAILGGVIYLLHCGGSDALTKRAPISAAVLVTVAIQAGAMAWWMLPTCIAGGALVEWMKTRLSSAGERSGSYPDVAMYLTTQALTFAAAPMATYGWFIAPVRRGPRDPDLEERPAAPLPSGAAIIPVSR